MKRPLLVSGLIVLFWLVFLFKIESLFCSVLFFAFFAAAAVFSVSFLKRKKKIILTIIFISIALASLLHSANMIFNSLPAESLIGTKTISAKLDDYIYKSNSRYCAKLKLEDVQNKHIYLRASFSSEEYFDFLEDAEVDDILTFEAQIYKSGDSLHFSTSLESNGIYITVYPKSEIVLQKGQQHGLIFAIKKLRHNANNFIIGNFDENVSSIAVALLSGDKNGISDETYEIFQKAGTAHIFAVSGMHLSLWVLIISKIFEFFKIKKRSSNLILILFCVFFVVFSGFTPSVMRAALMTIVYLFGYFFAKQSDGLNSLGFSILLLLIFKPYLCLNAGFLLSVFATFGIFAVGLPLIELFKNRIKFKSSFNQKLIFSIISAVCISFGAWVFTLPMMILTFKRISFVSVISNMLIYPFAAPLVLFVGLWSLFYFIPLFSTALHFLVEIFSRILFFASALTAQNSFSTFEIDELFVPIIFIISILFIILSCLAVKSGRLKLIVASLSAALIILSSVSLLTQTTISNCLKVSLICKQNNLFAAYTYHNSSKTIYSDCSKHFLLQVQNMNSFKFDESVDFDDINVIGSKEGQVVSAFSRQISISPKSIGLADISAVFDKNANTILLQSSDGRQQEANECSIYIFPNGQIILKEAQWRFLTKIS